MHTYLQMNKVLRKCGSKYLLNTHIKGTLPGREHLKGQVQREDKLAHKDKALSGQRDKPSPGPARGGREGEGWDGLSLKVSRSRCPGTVTAGHHSRGPSRHSLLMLVNVNTSSSHAGATIHSKTDVSRRLRDHQRTNQNKNKAKNKLSGAIWGKCTRLGRDTGIQAQWGQIF